jgi:hypothetical protein
MSDISVDFETFYSKKLKYSLKGQIAEQYCRSDLFDCYLISVCDGTQSWAGHPKNFCWSALEGQHLISHNRYFDNTVYNEMVRRKLAPAMRFNGWDCTANLTSFVCNRRALQEAIEFLYPTAKVDKSYRETADGRRWEDCTPEQQKQISDAGMVDAVWCHRVWRDFSPLWSAMERRVSNITIDQGMRGVQVNVDRLNSYIIQAHEMKMSAEQIIPWIKDAEDPEWDDFNTKPTSTKCIAQQCRKVGIPCPKAKSDDEEEYEAWVTLHAPRNPWIKAVEAWRAINKFYKTLLTMKERLRPDGTLPFGLKYFGAHTGRWAGAEKINMQNMRKVPLFCNQQGLMETDEAKINHALEVKYNKEHPDFTGQWPAWVRYALDFRALFIPRPGKKMITSDLSQIEPRVLAWLSKNHRMLELMRTGLSVYEAFAGRKFSKEEKKRVEYKMVKIMVLGLGYGAGWEKFITIGLQNGVDLCANDPEFETIVNPMTLQEKQIPGYGCEARRVVKKFRDEAPLITGMWRNLDEQFKSSIGSDFIMRLPSGRKLTYSKVRCETRIEKHPETGKPIRKDEFTADVGGKRKKFYGGKLTENITQAVARDVFASHVVSMEDQGWSNLFSAHDEAILEVDPSVKASDVQTAMSRCPEWLTGCPITAEASEVEHYQK